MWDGIYGGTNLVKQLAEYGEKIRLAPGVIGKGAMMWTTLIVVWGVVLFKVSPTAPLYYNLLLLGGAGVLTGLVTRETGKMRAYAEKNPSTALLEGAELVAFRRIEAQAKELTGPDKSPPTTPEGGTTLSVVKKVDPQ